MISDPEVPLLVSGQKGSYTTPKTGTTPLCYRKGRGRSRERTLTTFSVLSLKRGKRNRTKKS